MCIDIAGAISLWEELGGYASEKKKATKNKSTEKKQKSAAEFVEPDGIVIYTDGSMRSGTGGYCSVVMKDHEFVTSHGKQVPSTTNNQMEILGVLSALVYVKHNNIKSATIYSDSEYVVKGLNEWVSGWIRNGWKTASGKDVANKELWERMVSVVTELKRFGVLLCIAWISGHHGTEGNERADKLANFFSELKVDV